MFSLYLRRAIGELKNNQNGWRFWELPGCVLFLWPAGTAMLTSQQCLSQEPRCSGGPRAPKQGLLFISAHWCVGPLMQRHPRGSTQIWAGEVGCLSQKADRLLTVMSRNTFGISEPTAVHLLSALSPTFASSVWNSPEELSNNLIDSTAVNWRIPHYTHREEPWKSLWKNLFSQSVFYIHRSNSILSSYILWCRLIPDDHFLS